MKTIDIHTHGIGGYDTRTTSAEDILEIARIHGSHGVSAMTATIYPGPIDEMRRSMAAVKQAMELQVAGCNLHVAGSSPDFEVASARIIGIHLEGPFLNPSRNGALDCGSFVSSNLVTFERLIEGFEDVVGIITVAPELEGATKLIKAAADRGIRVSMGHSDATFAEAEAGFHAGAKGITHIFNAMRPFLHREPGIAGFGLMNRNVYVEVIADPFHLHPETIKLIFATKDPRKIVLVSDSVKETRTSGIGQRAEGRRQANRGHGDTDVSHGIMNTDGILQGGSMTITEAADRLMQLGIEKDLILPCISSNPASYLGIAS